MITKEETHIRGYLNCELDAIEILIGLGFKARITQEEIEAERFRRGQVNNRIISRDMKALCPQPQHQRHQHRQAHACAA